MTKKEKERRFCDNMSEKTLGVSYNNNEKNPIVIRKRGRRKNVTMRLNVFRLNALSGG